MDVVFDDSEKETVLKKASIRQKLVCPCSGSPCAGTSRRALAVAVSAHALIPCSPVTPITSAELAW